MHRTLARTTCASMDKNDKGLYSQIWELGRKVDNILSTSKHLPELFSADAGTLRRRLREKCEKLLVIPNSVYRRKTEDLLWKKVFYDVIAKCRGAKKYWSASDGIGQAYQRHLATILAFYKDLIAKLEKEYGMTFTGAQPTDLDPDDENGQWLKTACYRCLIHMGDAARYQFELVMTGPHPVTFYHSAIALDPTNGTAFNQLAALAGDKNECFNAAYYYWRSLTSPEPFKGAEENLKKVADKVKAQYHWLSTQEALVVKESDIRQFIRKKFLVKFLMLQMMFTRNEIDTSQDSVSLLCEEVIQDMEECFELDLHSYTEHPFNNDTPPDLLPLLLPCDLVLKLASTVILTSHSLRIKGSAKTPLATALALAVCSQLLEYCIQRLRRCLQYRVWLLAKGSSIVDGNLFEIMKISSQQSMLDYLKTGQIAKLLGFSGEDPIVKVERRKSRLKAVDRKRRRRVGLRRRDDSSGSEGDSTEDETREGVSSDSISDFEDLGEDEVQLLEDLSTSEDSEEEGPLDQDHTLNLRAQVGRGKRHNIVLAAAFSNPVPNPQGSVPSPESSGLHGRIPSGSRKPQEKIPLSDHGGLFRTGQFAMDVLGEEKFLMVIKVFGDWLQATPVVIATCTQSSSLLWSRLAGLLNFIPSEHNLMECGYATPLELTHPPALTEDEVMRGFAPLVRTQEQLNYSLSTSSSALQAANRAFYLHGFGQFVANAKTVPLFTFNKDSQKYIGPAQKKEKEAELASKEDKRKEREMKEKQSKLMKTMAKHRLETEVADLSKQKALQPNVVTPFLLPDAATLCNNLHIVKKLMKTERFVIVIARSVLDMLDQMKKDKGNFSAREAIKFLEKEFQQKNKFFKPQSVEETVDPQAKRAHKQDLETWHFQQLVNCAVYFTRASLEVTLRTCPATLLLDTSSIESDNLKELVEHARSHAVDIDTPLSFFRHWNKQSD